MSILGGRMKAMLLHSPMVPKIRLVRNPYARLLSGFLDKMVPWVNGTGLQRYFAARFRPRGYSRGGTFAQFARRRVHV